MGATPSKSRSVSPRERRFISALPPEQLVLRELDPGGPSARFARLHHKPDRFTVVTFSRGPWFLVEPHVFLTGRFEPTQEGGTLIEAQEVPSGLVVAKSAFLGLGAVIFAFALLAVGADLAALAGLPDPYPSFYHPDMAMVLGFVVGAPIGWWRSQRRLAKAVARDAVGAAVWEVFLAREIAAAGSPAPGLPVTR